MPETCSFHSQRPSLQGFAQAPNARAALSREWVESCPTAEDWAREAGRTERDDRVTRDELERALSARLGSTCHHQVALSLFQSFVSKNA